MASVINLEDLVPGLEGKTFRIPSGVDEAGAKKYDDYHVPGDLDSETVFEFLSLFEDMVAFRQRTTDLQATVGDNPEDESEALAQSMKALHDLNDAVKEKLLAVFQIANPDLKKLPFGAQTTLVVLGEILAMMGIAGDAQDLPVPPVPPKPAPRPRRQPADRKPKARKPRTTR